MGSYNVCSDLTHITTEHIHKTDFSMKLVKTSDKNLTKESELYWERKTVKKRGRTSPEAIQDVGTVRQRKKA